jgi:putative phosphoribosyl transferase
MTRIFQNREEAGRLLGRQLKALLFDIGPAEAIVLALPRGGVPVAFEIAQALGLNMDVLIVRKIGHPLQPEYGIGAITEEGYYWFDPEAIGIAELTEADKIILEEVGRREVDKHIKKYRNKRGLLALENKTVILADDGLATGVTARVAAKYIKARGAKKVILAAPVCAERTAEELRREIDEVICLQEPSGFWAVGQFYLNFDQVTDDEVLSLLRSVKVEKRASQMPDGEFQSRSY